MRTPQINTMAALAHENVSQVYTTIQEHGCTNLVMEIIGGGELFDTVKLWKRDTRERLTFHYFNQLTTGLKFLHSAGFAHRDLKLENLLLTTAFSMYLDDVDLLPGHNAWGEDLALPSDEDRKTFQQRFTTAPPERKSCHPASGTRRQGDAIRH